MMHSCFSDAATRISQTQVVALALFLFIEVEFRLQHLLIATVMSRLRSIALYTVPITATNWRDDFVGADHGEFKARRSAVPC